MYEFLCKEDNNDKSVKRGDVLTYYPLKKLINIKRLHRVILINGKSDLNINEIEGIKEQTDVVAFLKENSVKLFGVQFGKEKERIYDNIVDFIVLPPEEKED